MRHKARRLRLNQKPDHARIMQRNLVTSLILFESIRTTRKRARVIQPLVDSVITTAKTKSPQLAIRSINTQVNDVNASRKLMEVLTKRYATRSSGFTRVKPVGARKGDGAEMVDVTLVDAELATSASAKTQKNPKTQTTQKKKSSVSSLSGEAPAGAKSDESSKKSKPSA
jgi:large subunit ribosomal protein L17